MSKGFDDMLEWLKNQFEPEMVTVKDEVTGVSITMMPAPWFDKPVYEKILDYEPEPKEPELEYPQ